MENQQLLGTNLPNDDISSSEYDDDVDLVGQTSGFDIVGLPAG
jgi:hypothetical protein